MEDKKIDKLFQVGLNEKPVRLIDKLVKRALINADYGIPLKRVRSSPIANKNTFGDIISSVEAVTPKERSFPYGEWEEKIRSRKLELVANSTSNKLTAEQLRTIEKVIIELLTHNQGLSPKHSSRIFTDDKTIPKRLRYLVSYEPGKYMLC